jgi:hypothetical protein
MVVDDLVRLEVVHSDVPDWHSPADMIAEIGQSLLE